MAGMGARPTDGGVTFRLWSPNAQAVSVVLGSVKVPMAPDGDGTWHVETDSATVGSPYTYLITTAGGVFSKVDPYAVQTRDAGAPSEAHEAVVSDPSVFDWGQTEWREPGWTELVVYELHVASFNAPHAGQVGMFADVIDRLPALADLGVNAIELLPVAGFEGSVSWGYDPGVPFAVTNAYGGPEGLQQLVRAAHEHGIAVLLDVVYNHLGPDDSILWQFDGFGPGWEGGVYFYGTQSGRSQTQWGSRPDYGRPQVRRYFVDKRAGAAGDVPARWPALRLNRFDP